MKTAIFLAAATLLSGGPAMCDDYKLGTLTIEHPWARPTPGDSKVGAAYLAIRNQGTEPDTLVSAASQDSEKAQIHSTMREGDVMKMREMQGGIAVPAGTAVTFAPGGNHIMLLGLKHKLEEGQHIPMTLTFAKAGPVNVEVYVQRTPEGTTAQPPEMSHMH
jgi:periplasmic copper chaperone A